MTQRQQEGWESGATEDAWVSVIRKMDEAYADLVRYQVQVEEQNAALEEARNFFDSVQSAMSDVLIACDQEGKIQQVNRAFEEITGRSQDSLLGQPWRACAAAQAVRSCWIVCIGCAASQCVICRSVSKGSTARCLWR